LADRASGGDGAAGEPSPAETTRVWTSRLAAFLPDFMERHPAYRHTVRRADVIFQGSTTFGVDDDHSDLDLSVLMTDEDLAAFDSVSGTRYIDFELGGKPGSLKAEPAAELSARVDRCDMPLIAELRPAVVMLHGLGTAEDLIARARRPMRDEVRRAFFFLHYFEMRSYHRSADNPMERGDAVAAYLSTAEALAHALRASMVLHGEPYPYEKWLYRFAIATPTGAALVSHVDALLGHLAADGLRLKGPERDNPISQEMRAIRAILIEAAHAGGIDEPWLTRWWLFINQARAATRDVVW
jgi:hypothetical protein